MTREAALAAPPVAAARGAGARAESAEPAPRIPDQYRFSWRRVPRDVKLMAIGLVVVSLAAIGYLFVPWKTRPVVPLLGWSEPPQGRPSPPPTTIRRRGVPSPSPSPKKGWLPW
jgi:hypothetical protein